ncbi:hypothetical protein D5086_009106 [Populus alba]|uniref:Uncharacterized protein n=1 Tax=Populus alba TaxID=43335 RepID=A0ACC4CHL9_POPAL
MRGWANDASLFIGGGWPLRPVKCVVGSGVDGGRKAEGWGLSGGLVGGDPLVSYHCFSQKRETNLSHNFAILFGIRTVLI